MTRRTETIEPSYFESLYTADPDPWRFATSEYESMKYATSLAALQPGHYRTAFEVGCSIGIFTNMLSDLCGTLLAVDVAETALRQAPINCTHTNVTFKRCRVPADWPDNKFDLIVFSEMLYYLAPDDLRKTANMAIDSLNQDGKVLLVHYLGTTDYPMTGQEAAELFIETSGLSVVHTSAHQMFRIDLLSA